ncbi:MAG: HIT family protein [Candidatus Daviesbacteria bacterium]|nr:MAG: HIT family protein [Candidatus Daviesbacteria bacterium]
MAERHPNCVFCKIVAGEIPSTKVLEDDGVLAIKDIQPIAEGHIVVLSQNHYAEVGQMPAAERAQLFNTAIELGEEMIKKGEAEGYNVVLSSNEAAQSSVAHRPHLHVIPRKTGDDLRIDPRT